MLKFQRNWTKPELIRIFLVIPIHRFTQQRKQWSPIATEKHEDNVKWHFGKKYPELLPENWKLNGNIFFELFLGYLGKKIDLVRLQKRMKQKT